MSTDTRFDLSLDPRGLSRTRCRSGRTPVGMDIGCRFTGQLPRVVVATVQRGGAAPTPERAGATSKSPRASADYSGQRAPPGESSHAIAHVA